MELVAWISAISTILLVIITGIYVIITYKILKSSAKALNEQLRPYIVVDMTTENNEIFLRIRNIGKRGANNLVIQINPPLDDIILSSVDKSKIYFDYKPILKQSFFSPGYEINFFINWGEQFLKNKDNEKRYIYMITTTYADSNNNSYQDYFTIDLDNIMYGKKAVFYNDVHYISEISKTLKEMKEKYFKKR